MLLINFLKSILSYRKLIWEMAKRDLKNRYAGSYLGLFWTVVVPLLSSLVYIMVFSILMRGEITGRYSGLKFPVYYFCGYAPWFLFSETFLRNLGIVTSNSNLVTKISFPTQILPFSTFLSSLVSHLVILSLVVGLMLYHGVPFSPYIYLLPVYFIFLFLITMGLSLFFSAVTVFVRDLVEIMPILLSLFFFCIPVLYTPDTVRDTAPHWVQRLLIDYNPFYYIVDGYRSALLGVGTHFEPMGLIVLGVASLVSVIVGATAFRVLKRSFADVL